MPIWLIVLLGAGLVYLIKQGQTNAVTTPLLPSLPGTTPTATGTTSYADDIPTPADSVAAPIAVGQGTSIPSGTALFSDSKLTQSAGSSPGLAATVTGTGVAADGSISLSYYDPSGKTLWFAQPGT